MNREELSGLVLTMQEFSERDGILHLLTKEGVVSVFCKGVQTSSSKNRRLCNPFSRIHIEVEKKGAGMPRLIHGNVDWFAWQINEDLQKQCVCLTVNEVAATCSAPGSLYSLLETVWKQAAANKEDWLNYACLLVARVLDIEGIVPYVDGCVICGRMDGICTVSLEQAGFLCTEHAGLQVRWNRQDLKKVRYLIKAGQAHLEDIPAPFKCELADFLFLARWYQHYSHADLPTLHFLRSIESLY